MRFIETAVFTREVWGLLADEEYRALQLALLLRPGQGPVIPNGGGLRKLRWKTGRGGKRGGVRLIYYWHKKEDAIYVLYACFKTERDDLTSEQLRILRDLVRRELK